MLTTKAWVCWSMRCQVRDELAAKAMELPTMGDPPEELEKKYWMTSACYPQGLPGPAQLDHLGAGVEMGAA